jgi:large subunit ribosomal protein L5e
MIQQDKNKYDTKKYRFVVRKTNAKIICQVITAHPNGDKIEFQAESTELKRFGLTAGLTNYAAAYATGLLLARRLLKAKGMDTIYDGIKGKDVDGEYVDMYRDDGEHINEERRPFRCILDIGIYRATTGNRVFGALKGFSDGGIFIKHNNKRFPGFKIIPPAEKGDKKKETYDPEIHKNKIFGHYINEHYTSFTDSKKKGELKINKQQFSQWEKCIADNKVKSLQELYTKVHEAIRKNPVRETAENKKKQEERSKKAVRKAVDKKAGIFQDSKGRKWLRNQKLTNEERKVRVAAKLGEIIREKVAAAAN